MKTKHIASLAALALTPALLAFHAPLASLRFAPEAGTKVTKRFKTVTEMQLDEMDVLMNGQDTGGMMPQMEMDMNIEQNLVVVDTYVRSADGRPLQLQRTFDKLAQDNNIEMTMEVMGETQDQSQEMPATSELEGKTVVFTWDEDAEEYTKAYGEDDAGEDEDLLAGLIEDMDLRFLLPTGDVSEGDEWDLDMKRLPDLFAPGGDFAWDVQIDGMSGMPGMGGNPEMMSNLRQMMGDMLEGEAKARFTGMEEGMAVIELSIQIDAAQDMTEFMEAAMAEAPAAMMPDIERMDAEVGIESRGKLLWNTRTNHIGGLRLEGDISVSMDMEMSMDTGQAPITIEVSMSMSGNMEMVLETE